MFNIAVKGLIDVFKSYKQKYFNFKNNFKIHCELRGKKTTTQEVNIKITSIFFEARKTMGNILTENKLAINA